MQFPHDPDKQEALNNLRMGGLLEEMRVLIDALMIIDSKIVLCHNDLHEGEHALMLIGSLFYTTDCFVTGCRVSS